VHHGAFALFDRDGDLAPRKSPLQVGDPRMQHLGALRQGLVLDSAVCRLQVYRMLRVRPVQSDIRHDLPKGPSCVVARRAWRGSAQAL
jgi:hypothetical protein